MSEIEKVSIFNPKEPMSLERRYLINGDYIEYRDCLWQVTHTERDSEGRRCTGLTKCKQGQLFFEWRKGDDGISRTVRTLIYQSGENIPDRMFIPAGTPAKMHCTAISDYKYVVHMKTRVARILYPDYIPKEKHYRRKKK